MTTRAGHESAFTLSQTDRDAVLLPELIDLTEHHRARCGGYERILAAIGYRANRCERLADLPWLPVRLFKNHVLRSIDEAEVFKLLTSSGTTGQVSRIYLDRHDAAAQQRVLATTLRSVLGGDRLPMLVIDSWSQLADRRQVSTRAAAVLGLMQFGRDYTFALDAHGQVDVATVRRFVARHGGRPFLIFGFTYLVWLHLLELAQTESLDLSRGTLMHTGGWKHLADLAVDPATFRRRLADEVGLSRIHDFYGMVEQIGSIFMEGPEGGSLYCHDRADVIIRDPASWEELPVGVPGVIEVMSTLPRSYPGHVVLTEDLGLLHGIDDGTWPGKRFSVLGRLPRAEARGCSDTLPAGPA